ncbi:hypothetical protein ABLB96_11885 [Acinetobacter sp. XH1741]|uniref:hypothetical protein n=1 Tax=unclassified Acinetobacter TaxID=196816 RepID=UPI0032B4D11F
MSLMTTVENITELLAIQNPADGQVVYVKSYHLGLGKGGGQFEFNSTKINQNDEIINFNGWIRINIQAVTPEMAGARGDGITNDSEKIQKMIEFIFKNKFSMYCESTSYGISQTLIIPRNNDQSFVNDRFVELDFKRSDFVMLANTTLFTSGYYNLDNLLISSFGQPFESQNTYFTLLQNFTISSKVGYLTKTALTLQDWHQGCEVKNISSHVCQTILESRQSFYCKFKNINGSYSGGLVGEKTGNRFVFTGDHNLCSFEQLVAVNSINAYTFDGSVTACYFNENSIEGVENGLIFNSTVFDIMISNNYIEGITGSVVKFNSYVHSSRFSNNYINFVNHPEAYFIEHIPLPANNIYIESSNHFINLDSDKQIFKNFSDVTYSNGIVFERYKTNSNDYRDLLADNMFFSKNMTIKKDYQFTGCLGKSTNVYVSGNYAGRFSKGMDGLNGAKWVNTFGTDLKIETAILNSQTQRIYVNLAIDNGNTVTFIAGEFIGGWSHSNFYKFTDTGLIKSNDLNLTVGEENFVQINGKMLDQITQVVGEVRLI